MIYSVRGQSMDSNVMTLSLVTSRGYIDHLDVQVQFNGMTAQALRVRGNGDYGFSNLPYFLWLNQNVNSDALIQSIETFLPQFDFMYIKLTGRGGVQRGLTFQCSEVIQDDRVEMLDPDFSFEDDIQQAIALSMQQVQSLDEEEDEDALLEKALALSMQDAVSEHEMDPDLLLALALSKQF